MAARSQFGMQVESSILMVLCRIWRYSRFSFRDLKKPFMAFFSSYWYFFNKFLVGSSLNTFCWFLLYSIMMLRIIVILGATSLSQMLENSMKVLWSRHFLIIISVSLSLTLDEFCRPSSYYRGSANKLSLIL